MSHEMDAWLLDCFKESYGDKDGLYKEGYDRACLEFRRKAKGPSISKSAHQHDYSWKGFKGTFFLIWTPISSNRRNYMRWFLVSQLAACASSLLATAVIIPFSDCRIQSNNNNLTICKFILQGLSDIKQWACNRKTTAYTVCLNYWLVRFYTVKFVHQRLRSCFRQFLSRLWWKNL